MIGSIGNNPSLWFLISRCSPPDLQSVFAKRVRDILNKNVSRAQQLSYGFSIAGGAWRMRARRTCLAWRRAAVTRAGYSEDGRHFGGVASGAEQLAGALGAGEDCGGGLGGGVILLRYAALWRGVAL